MGFNQAITPYNKAVRKDRPNIQLILIGIISLALLWVLTRPYTDAPPKNQTNACDIFKEYPRWYWLSQQAETTYRLPISVQLAIIHEESHFKAEVRTKKRELLGIIPWGHISSARGYTQALDATWARFKRETHRPLARRDSFYDAAQFLGWFSYRAQHELGIVPSDSYHLYLAYHEGIGGYRRGSYRHKPWLLHIARKVQHQASLYRQQLMRCKQALPTHWWEYW